MSSQNVSLAVPAFYQIVDYVADTDNVVPRTLNPHGIHIQEASRQPFETVKEYFKEMSVERSGILYGEYLLTNDLLLLRRDGLCIKANMAWEDPLASKAMDDYCFSPGFAFFKQEILAVWDQLPTVPSMPLIANTYGTHYYHWTFETVTKNRFFRDRWSDELLLPELYLSQAFQREMIIRTCGDRKLLALKNAPIRVRDPMLSYELMSEANVLWLRDKVNLPVEAGSRRIYLRQSKFNTHSPRDGRVSESPEFLALLKEYGFEVCDFCPQDLGLEEQLRLLAKASVILAPQGSILTNLAYLSPQTSIIEIIGPKMPRAVFMHIASIVGLQYYGVFGRGYDENTHIVVDVDELRATLRDCTA